MQSEISDDTTTLSTNIIKENWPHKVKWSINETEKSGITDNRINTNIEDLQAGETYTLVVELINESGQSTGIKDSKQFTITMSENASLTAPPPKELEGGGGSISWLIMALAGLLAETYRQRTLSKSKPHKGLLKITATLLHLFAFSRTLAAHFFRVCN